MIAVVQLFPALIINELVWHQLVVFRPCKLSNLVLRPDVVVSECVSGKSFVKRDLATSYHTVQLMECFENELDAIRVIFVRVKTPSNVHSVRLVDAQQVMPVHPHNIPILIGDLVPLLIQLRAWWTPPFRGGEEVRRPHLMMVLNDFKARC